MISKKSSAIYIFLAFLTGALAMLVYMQYKQSSDTEYLKSTVSKLSGELDDAVLEIQKLTGPEVEPAQESEDIPQSLDESAREINPVASFYPGGQFTDQQRSEINTKLVRPYFDYYNETKDHVLAIHIKAPTEFGPYDVLALNSDGSFRSFLWGNSVKIDQDWWNPDCFDSCSFSEKFKQAYPLITE